MYLSTVTLMRYGPEGFHAMFDDGYFKPSGTMLSACGVGVFFFLTNFFNKVPQRLGNCKVSGVSSATQ